MKNYFLIFITSICLCLSLNVRAKNIGGCFQATESCEAFQSFRKKTNPGNVRLNENSQYKVLESSKKMKAYRIEVNGVDKSARWVTKRCGDWLKSCTVNKEQISNKNTRRSTRKHLNIYWP